MSRSTSPRSDTSAIPAPASSAIPNQLRLEALVTAGHDCISIVTQEETYALDLIKATVMRTGHRVLIWSATRGVFGGLFEDSQSVENTEHPAAALYHFGHQLEAPALCVTLDLVGHLTDPRTLRALRDVIHSFPQTDSCLVMLDHDEHLPQIIAAQVTPLELSLPSEKDLELIIRGTLRRMHRDRPVKASMTRSELKTVTRNLRGLTRTQSEQIIIDCVSEDRTFDAGDINTVLAHKRQRLHRDGILEYVEAPVDLSEIGGLGKLKRWLKQRRHALGDEAKDFGLEAPRGVLLLGVQGAGKSLCAKAIAAAWQRPLLRLDPGVLYDRYIGESERRLRSALHQASDHGPHHPLDRRDREGVRLRSQPFRRWRVVTADVRHAPDMDAGTRSAGVSGRNREQHRRAAPGAAP